MLREAIHEARTKHEVYFVDDTLWVAYGQGSGTTSYMPDITRAINNKSGDERFDTNVDRIINDSNLKPLKTNKDKDVFLYEIPYYPYSTHGKLDIWGGDFKPTKKYYMIVNTSGVAVVNIFDKKAEAMAWMRSV